MPDLARRDDRRHRRKVQSAPYRTQEEAQNAAQKTSKRTSGGKGTSIPPLSEEKRDALVDHAREHIRANKEVYEALARE